MQKEIKIHKCGSSEEKGLSFKRKLRLIYGYVGHYLVRLGGLLPKNGRPMKLIVVAEKKFGPELP